MRGDNWCAIDIGQLIYRRITVVAARRQDSSWYLLYCQLSAIWRIVGAELRWVTGDGKFTRNEYLNLSRRWPK